MGVGVPLQCPQHCSAWPQQEADAPESRTHTKLAPRPRPSPDQGTSGHLSLDLSVSRSECGKEGDPSLCPTVSRDHAEGTPHHQRKHPGHTLPGPPWAGPRLEGSGLWSHWPHIPGGVLPDDTALLVRRSEPWGHPPPAADSGWEPDCTRANVSREGGPLPPSGLSRHPRPRPASKEEAES